jgi:hypothetical protein
MIRSLSSDVRRRPLIQDLIEQNPRVKLSKALSRWEPQFLTQLYNELHLVVDLTARRP